MSPELAPLSRSSSRSFTQSFRIKSDEELLFEIEKELESDGADEIDVQNGASKFSPILKYYLYISSLTRNIVKEDIFHCLMFVLVVVASVTVGIETYQRYKVEYL